MYLQTSVRLYRSAGDHPDRHHRHFLWFFLPPFSGGNHFFTARCPTFSAASCRDSKSLRNPQMLLIAIGILGPRSCRTSLPAIHRAFNASTRQKKKKCGRQKPSDQFRNARLTLALTFAPLQQCSHSEACRATFHLVDITTWPEILRPSILLTGRSASHSPAWFLRWLCLGLPSEPHSPDVSWRAKIGMEGLP